MAVVRQGRRYRLGRTEVYGGIWRKRPWGWRLVARYPLNDDGWRVAEAQFSMWEPDAQPAPAPVPPSQADRPDQTPGEHTPPVGIPVIRQRRHVGAFGWVAIALSALILAGAGVLTDHLVAGKSTPSASRTNTTTSAKGGSKTSTNGATKNPTKTYTLPPVGGGWLAHTTSWVMFIQWSSNQGAFSGTAQYDKLVGLAPNLSFTTTSIPVSGTLSGNQITLSFYGTEEFGTVSTGRFTVNFPQKTGALAPITFVATTAAQYNRVLAALQARASTANAAAAAAQAKAKAETQIDQTVTAVFADIQSLTTQEASLSRAVTGVKSALAAETQALVTTKQELAQVNSCDAAGTVRDRAGTVVDREGTLEDRAITVNSDITSIEGEVSALKTAWATLEAQESALPSYLPAVQPTQTGVTKAVSSAQAAVSAALAATNKYIAQANAEAKTAATVASTAERRGGCTTSSVTLPTPIPPISG